MMRRLAFLILLSAAPVLAQVGGATALPPNPDQIATNQIAHPAFDLGNFTGYTGVAACATVVTTPVPPGTAHAADLTGCAGGTPTVFEVGMTLHNHEAILFRWQGYASTGFVGSGLQIDLFDNSHGDGASLWTTARCQEAILPPSSVYVTGFCEYYPNIVEHGIDGQGGYGGTGGVNVRFQLNSPTRPGNNLAESLGFEIVDSAGHAQKITTAGTLGGSAPTFNDAGGTTTDGTAVWTDQGLNPPFYVTNIEAEEEWFPLRTFLLYPNYRGYLWSDLVPPKRFTQIQPVSAGSPFYNFLATGSAPVAGEVMGVTTIDPPSADALSQLTLVVKMATAAGCGSGVLATDSIAAPQSIQTWQFTPTQYGTLTVGNSYYVCSSLYVTSGLTLIDSYPDWKMVYENAAFRAGLLNWYDPNNVWYHNGQQDMLIYTYDRASSLRGTGTPTTYTGWLNSQAGLSGFTAPQATAATNGHWLGNTSSDYCAQGFTGVMGSITTFSGINPSNGSLPSWIQILSQCGSLGTAHWNILNNWHGFLLNESGTSANPVFTPTLTAATGTISANYLFLEEVLVSAPISQGNSPTRIPSLFISNGTTVNTGNTPCNSQTGYVGYCMTAPSTVLTHQLSADACAGTNCGVTFTTPACPNLRTLGAYIFAATGSTSTPPAQSAFQLQYPTVSGVLGNVNWIPCGSSVSLTSLSGGPAETSTTASIGDTTYNGNSGFVNGRPNWATNAQTDQTLDTSLFNTVYQTSYANGVGGMYVADEPSYYAMPYVWEIDGWLYADTPAGLSLPVSCILIQPTLTIQWRDICDQIGEDPYGTNTAESPDEWVTGESSTQTGLLYQGNGTLASVNDYYLSRADVYDDDSTRETFGARPTWDVIQEFGNSGNHAGFPYAWLHNQLWKSVIDVQVYGSLGPACGTWGYVDSSGLEQTALALHITQAWFDSKRATNECFSLMPILLTPVEDSPLLGLGTVVSAVSTSVTTAAACNIQSGQTSMYTSTANWPDAPAWFDTHTDPATGDQYIFVNNLCAATSPFNIVFTLANPPAGATQAELLFEGSALTIASGQITLPVENNDVHIIVIRTPRGMTIH